MKKAHIPIDFEYPREILEAFAALAALGVHPMNMAVAGGFCRDTIHGAIPKDIDIVITQTRDFEAEHIQELLPHWSLQQQYTEYQDQDPNTDFHERWEAVLQFKTRGFDVDLLFSQPAYRTVDDAVRMNDFNLNQYRATYRQVLRNSAPAYVGQTPEGILHRTMLTAVSPERVGRMQSKARAYGWVV